MSLNHDLIQARFGDIQQSLERLHEIRELPRVRFLADQDILDVTCYRLLVAIEAALQICFHVSARRLQRVPDTYAECFALLGEAGILPEDLSQDLQRMTRFRNMLVHVYWEVDYGLVYDALQEHLDDLGAFVRAISDLL
jgi:uncharacterized protein YutE (UPF0331/DUF86 family)